MARPLTTRALHALTLMATFLAAGGTVAGDEALLWRPGATAPPRRIRKATSRQKLRRHARKYSEGVLGPDRSFFFRGPVGALNLQAHNLTLFMQMGDGVDDATWLYHLRQGDYSRWMREAIKDDGLAEEVAAVENHSANDAVGSRSQVRQAIEKQGMTAAGGPPTMMPSWPAAATGGRPMTGALTSV